MKKILIYIAVLIAACTPKIAPFIANYETKSLLSHKSNTKFFEMLN